MPCERMGQDSAVQGAGLVIAPYGSTGRGGVVSAQGSVASPYTDVEERITNLLTLPLTASVIRLALPTCGQGSG